MPVQEKSIPTFRNCVEYIDRKKKFPEQNKVIGIKWAEPTDKTWRI